MIPESVHVVPPLRHNLPRYFQLAWKLVSEGAVGTRQEVITKLASEGGLHRIKELVEMKLDSSALTRVEAFKDLFSPFFQTLVHEGVLFSLLLETPIDTIHNFIFGPSGRRALALFGWILPTLPQLIFDSDDNDRFVNVAACLAVLQKTVDLNGTALILDEFHSMVTTLSAVIGEESLAAAGPVAQQALQSLTRTQRRLGLGSAIPQLEATAQSVTKIPSLPAILHDLPGLQSAEGPQHDNDHEDIAHINIMPTAQEIQSPRLEYLPLRDPTTWHLPGMQGLLDRQFRPLREDTIGQLRDAVGLEADRL